MLPVDTRPPARRPVRRLVRRPDRGLLGGVAAGIAEHVGLPRRTIRLCFVLLAVAGGLGFALYGVYWIVLPSDPAVGRRFPARVEAALATIVALIAVGALATSLPHGGLVIPTLLGCLGGALIWRQASEAQRDRLRDLSRRSLMADFAERNGLLRVVAGVALVAVGAVLILARSDLSTLRDGLPAIAVTVAGLALVTGPWWLRLVSAFNAERAERIRTQERADLAAKVHDSVLQTLALIQRNADSPREVVRLARGQERELRSLLYGAASGTSAGTLAEALSQAAAEVEDLYAVRVDVVTVGDVPARTDGGPRRRDLDALVAAAREAMSNAARHSGADTVSVFLEVDDDAISVFVRDRGVGFDPDSVSADRQGLRGSILARMQRHGGTATISARPGQGAEVALTLPRGEPT